MAAQRRQERAGGVTEGDLRSGPVLMLSCRMSMTGMERTLPETDRPVPPVVIKKYANRRLYDTEGSIYITLDSLAVMVRQGRDFVVFDAKTGDDITRTVLTQIIVEEETKGRNMLPAAFLRQLIGLYGDSMQGQVPEYLEHMMEQFAARRAAAQAQKGAAAKPGTAPSPAGRPAPPAPRSLPTWSVRSPGNGEAPAADEAQAEIRRLQGEIDRLNRELAARAVPGA